MATTATDSTETLLAKLLSLPQEIYDQIADLVLRGSQIHYYSWDPFFPTEFHIDRRSREHCLELVETASDEDLRLGLRDCCVESDPWELNTALGMALWSRERRYAHEHY